MSRRTRGFIALFFFAQSMFAADTMPGLVTSEFIFETAPFASCHACTLVETKSGLAAAWFGGTREGAADVCIYLANEIGGKWSAPVEVANGVQADGKRYPCWNPVLFQPHDGALMLFYKVGPSPSAWWGMLRTSLDEGKTWSDATRLLAKGEILCGSSSESNNEWRVHFELSGDLGKTWRKTIPAPDTGGSAGKPIDAIQPSVLFMPGGKLMALGRTRQKKIFQTESGDNGATWSALSLTALPNPNSGIDAVTVKDGRQLLIYNHTVKGRSPLNLALSTDGVNWSAALVLESDAGEFSYPAIIQARDGLVHVGYTWNRRRIRHCVIDLGKLELKAMAGGEWPK
jgi:predicted neuraminidase